MVGEAGPIRMKCYSLLLGARNTPSGGDRFSRAEDERIRRITSRHFPNGFTILHADGGWYDPQAQRFLREESRQILITASGRAAVRRWCRELGEVLRQQELLVVEVGPAWSFRPEEPDEPTRSRPHGKPARRK